MEEKKFDVKPNTPVGIFLAILALMGVYYLYKFIYGLMTAASFWVYIVFLVGMFYYFLGCRPYQYIVSNKEVIKKKRLFPASHLDLLKAENITDAVPRMADLITRPHAIEIYDENKKRYKYFPKDVEGFTGAVLAENKRIHCNVAAYTDHHRTIKKRARRDRRKA